MVRMKTYSLLIAFFLTSSLVSVKVLAEARKQAHRKILVAVGGQRLQTRQDAQRVCQFVLESASLVAPYDVDCVSLESIDDLIENKIGRAESSKQYQMYFNISGHEHGYSLKMENWGRADSVEIEKARWEINKDDLFAATPQIRDIITNALSFDLYKSQILARFLASGLSNSKAIVVNQAGQLMEKSTGRILNDQEAYTIFVNEHPKNKNYIRALEEIGVVVGLGTLNYWSYTLFGGRHKNPNQVDWQYDGLSGSLRRFKGFQGVRFDDNSRDTNMGHSLAGALYYQAARSNNLTSMESFLMSFAASTFWETVSEYREVISINDEIFTPAGGLAVGEVGFQFGKYFYSKENLMGKILSGVFDSSTALNRFIDGTHHELHRYEARQSGFDVESMEGYADFYVGKIYRSNPILDSSKENGKAIGMQGELSLIPYKDAEGVEREFYRDTVSSQIFAQVSGNSKDSFQTVDLLFKSVLMAYHSKNIHLDADEKKNGYSALVGISNGMSYNLSAADRMGKTDDWIAAIHVLGGTIDVVAYRNDIKFRATLDVFGDFAMVHSYAIDSYKQSHDGTANIQTTLAQWDYYYDMGITNMLHLSAESGRNTLELDVRQSSYRSIPGHDRYHEILKEELDTKDQINDQRISWTYQLNRDWRAKVIFQQIKRVGSINDGFLTVGTEKRLMGTLNYRF